MTVIPADHWIRIDDAAHKLPVWQFNDDNIHAIQWQDGSGEIEYTGKPKPVNQSFTDQAILEPYIAAFTEYSQSLLVDFTEPDNLLP